MNTITLKNKILKELHNHNSKNFAFYKKCIVNNYAFDVVVDGIKYEIHPCAYGRYCNGGEAYAKELYESEMPEFTEEELLND